jgi:hypothetical protein
MANVNNPFGFRWTRNLSGGAPTYQLMTQYILASYGTPIFRGDVITYSSGYVQLAAPDTAVKIGIFDGCEWQSQATKMPRFSPYWPGSDAPSGGYVKCQIITDPYAVFQVQTDGTAAVGPTLIGLNGQFVAGTGNTSTGQSGMTLSHTTNTTSTFPFLIVGVGGGPQNNWLQSDNTLPYNIVEVTWNNQWLRSPNTAI